MIADKLILYAAAAALALSTGGAVLQSVRLGAAKRVAAELRTTIAEERQDAAERAMAANEAARIEERRRSLAAQEVERVAQLQAVRVRADAVGARAAGDGLRVRVDAVAAGCDDAPGDPGATGVRPAAAGRCAVLANVLGVVVAHAVELARIADERGTAGAACERAYGSLTDGFGGPIGEGVAAPIREHPRP